MEFGIPDGRKDGAFSGIDFVEIFKIFACKVHFHEMNIIIQQGKIYDDVKVRPHYGVKGQILYSAEHLSLGKFRYINSNFDRLLCIFAMSTSYIFH